VAVVRDVRNPVTLARYVMERSEHVLLAGAGASAFARSVGIPACDPGELVTERQRERWSAAKGTVGAVARDVRGHLAAATSTGGTRGKLPGRVGDSALVGCGTYADDALAAVSCTGEGERIIRLTLARACAERVGRGVPAMEAAREAVALLAARVGGSGGLIVVGPRGGPGLAFNTPAMTRAWSLPDGGVAAEL
jgi:beta-aspartyl-peptidase (threonine type)